MKIEDKQCQIEIVPKTMNKHKCFTLFAVQCCSNVPKPEYEVLSHMLSCLDLLVHMIMLFINFCVVFYYFFKALASHFQPLNSMFHCLGMLFYEILKKFTNENEILAIGFQNFTNH